VRLLGVIALAGLALLAPGCSGESDDAATTSTAPSSTQPSTTGESQLEPAPETAAVLEQFIDAADDGDIDAMWQLLSATSREQLGPTREEFASERAPGFQRGLGSFAGTPYRIVLATETDSGWGIAAIAGQRTRGGEEEVAAYAVALRREGSEWKLELGAPIELRQISPPRVTSEARPEVEFEIVAPAAVDEAGLWLDGAALPATASGEAAAVNVIATPDALAPGWHVLTILGRSGDLAAAGAAAFYVDTGQTSTASDVEVA
jgi:hypothetical protein